MQCTACGKVWCPGEVTLCSGCARGASTTASLVGGVRPSSPDGVVGRMIPTGNKPALLSYYCGIAALLPFLGFILGTVAVVAGMKGLSLEKEHPAVRGGNHARVGTFLGGLLAVTWAVVAVLLATGALKFESR